MKVIQTNSRNKNSNYSKSTFLILPLLSFLFFSHAQGQNYENMETTLESGTTNLEANETAAVETTMNESSSSDEDLERIEVTGSYIKRIDIEGPSPLDIIDRSAFDQAGSLTVSDLLKENAAFEQVNQETGYVRFHGQHGGNVLILLNGLNIPNKGGGFFTSIQSLPSSVIQRVEILREGVSSLYGSTAMSGVINFITRTDTQGGALTTSTTLPEIGVGQRQSHTATYGTSGARGNILGMVQFERSEAVEEYDLGSYNTKPNVTTFPTSSGKFLQSSADKTHVLPIGNSCAPTPCESDPLQFNQVQRDGTTLSTFITTRYNFSDNIRTSLLAMYNRTQDTELRSPLDINWSKTSKDGDQSLNTTNLSPGHPISKLAEKGFDLSAPGIELKYKLDEELGPQIFDNLDETYNFQANVEGDMDNSTWSWRVQSGLATIFSSSHVLSGNANELRLRDMAISGKFDSLLPSGKKSDISAAMVSPTYKNTSNLFTVKALATGELGMLGEGPLSMSVGLHNQFSQFNIANDGILTTDELLTSPSPNFGGSRTISSAFAELASQPLNGLEIQLAGRFDRYSDVGDTWNPRLALSYRPTNQWLVRGSVGTAFRAPGSIDLYRGDTQELFLFTDHVKCDQNDGVGEACNRQFYTLNTFTTEISPETSLHYNIGTILQPTKSLTFIIDQWNFEGEQAIARIFPDEFTQIESEGYIDELNSLGVSIERDPQTGDLLSITTPYLVNRGEKTLRGLDFTMNWRYSLTQSIQMGLNSSHSYIFQRNKRTFSFRGVENEESSWKNITSLYLTNYNHYGRLAARTISANKASRRKNAPILPQTTVLDASYSYTTGWNGKFNLGVKNFLDQRPPVDKTGQILAYGQTRRTASAFSPLGRRYFLSYSQNF